MTKRKFQRILVLNRGEIACRLIQSIQESGKTAIAVFSDPDANARHVEMADEAFGIGGVSPRESYLDAQKLLRVASEARVDAVHPGYGFLSERADAARAFLAAGIAWIGPSPESIHQLGNKIEAKKLLDAAKVPTLPWSVVDPANASALDSLAQKIGFPLLLKAAAGGGGKGMRLVRKDEELKTAAEAASREGLSAFGDGAIFMERYLENPRHIEVQLMGDHYGNAVHFGERDCSSQRRHQKVIEEAPAPNLSIFARNAICDSAAALAKSVGYANAGTAEFLVDERENFYFLEMNSRLQVEHTVTELAWGIDLVRTQIRVAEGESLAEIFPNYKEMQPRGHAIQTRVYAEDAANLFMPCPGPLTLVEWPKGQGIRVDTGVESGAVIGMDYDPMIAKITVWAESRALAIEKALWALRHTLIFGTITNINYLQDILSCETFRAGKMHVKFLESKFAPWKDPVPEALLASKTEIAKDSRALAAGGNIGQRGANSGITKLASPWEHTRL